MNRKILLLPLLLLVLMVAACKETEEVDRYADWQARNEAFMDSLANVFSSQGESVQDPERLYRCADLTNNMWIYYKKHPRTDVEVDPDAQSPVYTSTVSMHYRMKNIAGDMLQETYSGEWPDPEFDTPVDFTLSGVISGWGYSIVYMKPGERWTLYLPYQSGYGENDRNGIRGYSNLIYDVQLEEIVEY